MSSGAVISLGGRNTTVRLCLSIITRFSQFIDWSLKLVIDVLSAALDSGVAIGAILVFFILQYPRNGTIGENTIETWWGNTVYQNTIDWEGAVLKTPGDSGIFGYVLNNIFVCDSGVT